MHNDSAEILDDILSRWHSWQCGYRASRGFSPKSLVTGDYRTSRQYDDVNGALDIDIDAAIMRQVDFEIGEMADPHRTAIYCLARALALGLAVFTSPRLPDDRAELEHIVRNARGILTARLVASGVI